MLPRAQPRQVVLGSASVASQHLSLTDGSCPSLWSYLVHVSTSGLSECFCLLAALKNILLPDCPELDVSLLSVVEELWVKSPGCVGDPESAWGEATRLGATAGSTWILSSSICPYFATLAVTCLASVVSSLRDCLVACLYCVSCKASVPSRPGKASLNMFLSISA